MVLLIFQEVDKSPVLSVGCFTPFVHVFNELSVNHYALRGIVLILLDLGHSSVKVLRIN